MSTAEDIYRRVVQVLVESLYVSEDDLTPTTSLLEDLGAESLDLLEIVFQLEREFEIDIPDGDLFPRSFLQSNADFLRKGCVTDPFLRELRSRMPYAEFGTTDPHRRLTTVGDLFTVGLVARYIAWKLDQSIGSGAYGQVPFTQNSSPPHQD